MYAIIIPRSTLYESTVLYGNIAERCIEEIREVRSANYVDVIGGNISPDHVHMLISVPPHLSILKVVQYIKGKSGRKLQGELQALRKRCQGHTYGRNDFCRNIRTDKHKGG